MMNIKTCRAILLFIGSLASGDHTGLRLNDSVSIGYEGSSCTYYLTLVFPVTAHPPICEINCKYIDFEQLSKCFGKDEDRDHELRYQQTLLERFIRECFHGNDERHLVYSKIMSIESGESGKVIINCCLRPYKKDGDIVVLAEWGQYGSGLAAGKYIGKNGGEFDIDSQVILSFAVPMSNISLFRYDGCILDSAKYSIINELCGYLIKHILSYNPTKLTQNQQNIVSRNIRALDVNGVLPIAGDECTIKNGILTIAGNKYTIKDIVERILEALKEHKAKAERTDGQSDNNLVLLPQIGNLFQTLCALCDKNEKALSSSVPRNDGYFELENLVQVGSEEDCAYYFLQSAQINEKFRINDSVVNFRALLECFGPLAGYKDDDSQSESKQKLLQYFVDNFFDNNPVSGKIHAKIVSISADNTQSNATSIRICVELCVKQNAIGLLATASQLALSYVVSDVFGIISSPLLNNDFYIAHKSRCSVIKGLCDYLMRQIFCDISYTWLSRAPDPLLATQRSVIDLLKQNNIKISAQNPDLAYTSQDVLLALQKHQDLKNFFDELRILLTNNKPALTTFYRWCEYTGIKR